MPALLTRIASGPSAASVPFTAASIEARSTTSTFWVSTLPFFESAAFASSIAFGSTSQRATEAPEARKRSAIA